jgi:predicted phage terminase large subunit-like protein
LTQAIEQLDLPALRDLAKKDLYFFAKGVLRNDKMVEHIHLPLCRFLMAGTTRKLIIIPRGWFKTTVCTIAYPIWLSINNPNIRILLVQNSSTNACKKLSVISSNWLENPLLRAMFPELLPGKNSTWNAESLCLSRTQSYPEGTYEAAGTNTKVVSRHYDVIIEDDTVAPDLDELGNETLAPTHDDVQKAIGWHRTNLLPLMNDPGKDTSLIVGTRWYDEDLISWVQKNDPDYKIMTRAVKENDQGEPDDSGKIAWPERFDQPVLDQLERNLGSYMYGALYMNTPTRKSDMFFKPEWFMYYDHMNTMELDVYTTVDPATDPNLSDSPDEVCDNVVLTTGKDRKTGYIYVLEYFAKRCNPGELIAAIFDHVIKYRPLKVCYENVAYQKSLDYWIKEGMKEHAIWFILEPIKRGGKDAKTGAIMALQPLFQNRVLFVKPWMKELISQFLKFPRGKFVDIADALSMHLQLWKLTRSRYEREQEQYDENDPLNYEAAVRQFQYARRAKGLQGLIYDPLYYGGTANGVYRLYG